MGKFGAFAACHFGKQLMLLHLLLQQQQQYQQLLLCIIVFTIRARFFSLLIDPLINLPPLSLLWLNLFSPQGEGSVLILPTSSTFLFQTTAPKSCYMRPPGGILAPGESIIATVFKFVEPPENNEKPIDQKSRVKFKIMSLKVKGEMDYVPELFDEQRDHVADEQILRVIFLDPERPSPALDKLKRQLAEAEAALEARKKPPEETGPRVAGEGLVIDEWKERRERYLARQQVEVVDSV
ncbi:vesicle-associated protein 4-2 isoform X2 [Glycine max]|uniref:MSP domain-containing protein n=1 Tax=Glycine max TaxID=3847 RepID=A0A0R0JMV8_SOYBN|nr:vesicle-associated protein 4-2 isoform X2 [Glycine max]|eukprot:XP_014632301.1 vesicle-associated protein 4-2 isoform X2 [Glycine max]